MHVVEVQVAFFRDILGPQICRFVVSRYFHFVFSGMHGWFLILIHSAETCNHPQPIPIYLTMQMNTLVKHIFLLVVICFGASRDLSRDFQHIWSDIKLA